MATAAASTGAANRADRFLPSKKSAFPPPAPLLTETFFFDSISNKRFSGYFRCATPVVTYAAPHQYVSSEGNAAKAADAPEGGGNHSFEQHSSPSPSEHAKEGGEKKTAASVTKRTTNRTSGLLRPSHATASAATNPYLSLQYTNLNPQKRGRDPTIGSARSGTFARQRSSSHASSAANSTGRYRSTSRASSRTSSAASSTGTGRRPTSARGSTTGTFARQKYDQAKKNHNKDVSKLSSNGLHTTLWIGSQDGSIEVRSVADPNYIINVIPQASARVVVTVLTQVGQNRVAAGFSDGSMRVFESASLTEFIEVRAHTAAITCMHVVMMPTANNLESEGMAYPRASVLLTGSLDWTIAKWDGVTMECLGRLHGSRRGIGALTSSLGGYFAYSGSEDGSLRMWSLTDNSQVELSREEKRSLSKPARRQQQHGKGPGKGPTGDAAKQGSDESETDELATKEMRATRASRPIKLKAKRSHAKQAQIESLQNVPSIGSSKRSSLLVGPGTSVSPLRERRQTGGEDDGSSCSSAASNGHTNALLLPKKSGAVTPRTVRRRRKHYLTIRIEEMLRNFYASKSQTALADRLDALYGSMTHTASNFNWPIESVHREAITALTVVEDKLLISASRDASARVFALPCGIYLRTLDSKRRVPLACTLVDEANSRLLVGSTDGAVTAYDLLSKDMPAVMQLLSSPVSFSSTYTVLPPRTLHRLFLVTTAAAEEDSEVKREKRKKGDAQQRRSSESNAAASSAAVTCVARMDRLTQAHGPNHSVSTYLVGEPSLREMGQALALAHQQKELLLNAEVREKMRQMGSIEEIELADGRRCGLTMQRAHARHLALCYFGRWTQWMAARRSRQGYVRIANQRARAHEMGVLDRFFHIWKRFRHTRENENFNRLVRQVRSQGATVDAEGVKARQADYRPALVHTIREAKECAVRFLAAGVEYQRQKEIFTMWRRFAHGNKTRERQEKALNRLVLSLSEGRTYSTAAFVLRQLVENSKEVDPYQGRLVTLAMQRLQSGPSTHELLLRYYRKWRTFSKQSTKKEVRLSRPPGAKALHQPEAVLRQYFHNWLLYAVYVAKKARSEEESKTLERELAMLENMITTSTSVEVLAAEKARLETLFAKTAAEQDALKEKERLIQKDLTRLQSNSLINGILKRYQPSNVSKPATSRTARENGEDDGALTEPWASAACSLRALRGVVMQCSRDQKLIVAANELVSTLPVKEPTTRGSVSLGPDGSVSNVSVTDLSASVNSLGSSAGATQNRQQRTPRSRQNPPPAVVWTRPKEKRYATLADAFDAIFEDVYTLLGTAAHEAGADMETLCKPQVLYVEDVLTKGHSPPSTCNTGESREEAAPSSRSPPSPIPLVSNHDDLSVEEGDLLLDAEPSAVRVKEQAAPAAAARQLAQVSSKVKKDILANVAKLICAFDSFTAHSDAPVELQGSLSTRGTATTRSLPWTYLCSNSVAARLSHCAPFLLELLKPTVWTDQLRLLSLQGAPCSLPVTNSNFTARRPLAKTPPAPPLMEDKAPTPRKPALNLSTDALSAHPMHARSSSLKVTLPRVSGMTATRISTNSPAPGGGSLNTSSAGTSRRQESPAPDLSPDSVAMMNTSNYSTHSGASTPRSTFSLTPRAAMATPRGGHVTKPYLGFRVNVGHGAGNKTIITVREIAPTYVGVDGEELPGPAAAVGLREGDQLVRFAGYTVTDLAAFNAIVSRHVRPGAEIPVVIKRNGSENINISLTVGQRST